MLGAISESPAESPSCSSGLMVPCRSMHCDTCRDTLMVHCPQQQRRQLSAAGLSCSCCFRLLLLLADAHGALPSTSFAVVPCRAVQPSCRAVTRLVYCPLHPSRVQASQTSFTVCADEADPKGFSYCQKEGQQAAVVTST